MPKTVQLSEDAYATLASLKKPGESFSDVVRRLAGERKDPTALLKLRGVREDFDFMALREHSKRLELERLSARTKRR